jgi:hypothetical protein
MLDFMDKNIVKFNLFFTLLFNYFYKKKRRRIETNN